jgi:choline/ethanolamine kinase
MPSMSPTKTDESTSLLSIADALKLISTFFPKRMGPQQRQRHPHLENHRRSHETLHHIRRTDSSILKPSQPLIRQFGLEGDFIEPQGTSIDLSAVQQAVVFWEMSRRGWGPKIYGFFPGGRLEEFVEGSHTLTAAESTRDPVRKDVARAYARLHSLQLPLRKDSFANVVRELERERGEQARGRLADVVRG